MEEQLWGSREEAPHRGPTDGRAKKGRNLGEGLPAAVDRRLGWERQEVPATFKHIFLASLEAEPGSCGRGELVVGAW